MPSPQNTETFRGSQRRVQFPSPMGLEQDTVDLFHADPESLALAVRTFQLLHSKRKISSSARKRHQKESSQRSKPRAILSEWKR